MLFVAKSIRNMNSSVIAVLKFDLYLFCYDTQTFLKGNSLPG